MINYIIFDTSKLIDLFLGTFLTLFTLSTIPEFMENQPTISPYSDGDLCADRFLKEVVSDNL